MAITTMDGIVAGMQVPQYFHKQISPTLVAGKPWTPFYTAGIPGAAVAPTPGAAGEALTSYAGQIPFTNPGAGNSYIERFVAAMTGQVGTLMLCDRLWHNSGLSSTLNTAQTVNSAAWPARDNAGSTNGDGVYIGVEVSGAMGAATPTFSMSYTNQEGTASKTGAGVTSGVSSAPVGSFYPMGLAAGDTGVRSIQTFTLSASWGSGTFHLVAYRILAAMEVGTSGNSLDFSQLGLPRMYDNTVPFLVFVPSTTTAGFIYGQTAVTQG